MTTITAKGRNGTLHFDGQFVTIARSGFLARGTIGKGEKRIPVSSIAAVQWKPAGAMANGFIQLTLPGGNEKQSRFGHQTADAVTDENSVVFTRKQMPDFEVVRNALESAIANRSASAAAAPDLTAQLAQLAALRDQGVLTDAEFDAKKTDLLARI